MDPSRPVDRRTRRRCGFVAAWALALVIGGPIAPLGAHEIGTTRVVVTVQEENEFTVDVTTDAAALLARLEMLAGRPRFVPADGPEAARAIAALRGEFMRQAHLSVDGKPAVTVFDGARSATPAAPEDALASAVVAVRLRGRLPAHARSFAWRYGLTSATYAMTAVAGGSTMTQWVEGDADSGAVLLASAAPPSRIATGWQYFTLGFTHILPNGVDHILFVVGVFLFSRRIRPMLSQISAFTVAHSLTLGLTLFGVVSFSPALVEPMIALSIVYVAIENLTASELRWRRLALVFAFGLLHGMGFAGALRESGLAASQLVLGLVAFNAGVEAGQLSVIAAAFVICARWSGNRAVYRRVVVVPASLLIAATGLYWTFERLPVW